MTTPDRNSPDFAKAVREAMTAAEAPIELGWDLLRRERARQGIHLTDKELFMAGAGYMFDAIIYMLDPSGEPTKKDLELMAKIHAELLRFHEHFNSKFKE